MYFASWACWFGTTVNCWIAAGYSRPIAIDAMNQTASVSPTGQRTRAKAPPIRSDPPVAVDELELVELVAERDRHQEQAGEDAEMDPDARVEHGRSGHRRQQVAPARDHE